MRIRSPGRLDYVPCWKDMQAFTDEREPHTPDEIWFTEHPPVFTLGMNAAREHLLAPGDIPVVHVDRGGQVTYHGPGQLMVYPLIDLKRARIGVRKLVCALENSVIDFCAAHGIEAVGRRDAPGVYVEGKKTASVGLRIRRGASYHGMAVNVDPDLEPFGRINPCGYSNLEVTHLRALGIDTDRDEIQSAIQDAFLRHLGIEDRQIVNAD